MGISQTHWTSGTRKGYHNVQRLKTAGDARRREFWQRMHDDPAFARAMVAFSQLDAMRRINPDPNHWRRLAAGLAKYGSVSGLISAQRRQRDAAAMKAKQLIAYEGVWITPQGGGGGDKCGTWDLGCKADKTLSFIDDNAGKAVDTVVKYRSTILAVAGGVACTAATAGAGAVPCTAVTVAAVANATVTTAVTTHNCGWREGLVGGAFEYTAALPGGLAIAAKVDALTVGFASAYTVPFNATNDAAGGTGTC